MMIYQDGTRMAFAVADLYGQEFAVGENFKPENYHPKLHYGINYLLAVGDEVTEVHFNCEQLDGITDMQLLSVLVDRITRRAVDSERPPFANLLRLRRAESKLREAFSALGELDA
jgi:hypothetical protein